MEKLTSKEVRKYMLWRADKELGHCPDCIAAACNDVAIEFSHDKAIDLLRLVFFNDHIPSLHTHSYSFNTATGRHIIETIKNKYYEYESNS
tara:strand:+ start:208 stop:480 length:273 start_codon:yes stop_codon:yes gene_type:complete